MIYFFISMVTIYIICCLSLSKKQPLELDTSGITSIDDKKENVRMKDYGVWGSGSSPSSKEDITYIRGIKSI